MTTGNLERPSRTRQGKNDHLEPLGHGNHCREKGIIGATMIRVSIHRTKGTSVRTPDTRVAKKLRMQLFACLAIVACKFEELFTTLRNLQHVNFLFFMSRK